MRVSPDIASTSSSRTLVAPFPRCNGELGRRGAARLSATLAIGPVAAAAAAASRSSDEVMASTPSGPVGNMSSAKSDHKRGFTQQCTDIPAMPPSNCVRLTPRSQVASYSDEQISSSRCCRAATSDGVGCNAAETEAAIAARCILSHSSNDMSSSTGHPLCASVVSGYP